LIKVTRPVRSLNFWVSFTLLLVTALVYAPVRHFDFVNLDDDAYITLNKHIQDGLSPAGLKWAVSSRDQGYWFPVTRLSYLMDSELSGTRPGGYHLTNLAFHLLATLLLFTFLSRATRATWPSAFAAFLFALHPLHIESVAWVTERKDVLCACFWFLTLWAWLRYAERPQPVRYLLALLAFALGLMSKAMIVTMPFALLLMNVWPLRRPFSKRLLIEQIPFGAISLASAAGTYFLQKTAGGIGFLGTLPLPLRLENAAVSAVVYIVRMFWPSGLSVLYPYPRSVPLWQAAACTLCLTGISILVLRFFRRFPYLAVGWFWYLGTLVPVIGLVQSGPQAHADRFVYIPMIGLSVMLAWGAADILRRWPRAAPGAAALAGIACVSLAADTQRQLPYWQNSETLFRRATEVTSGNYLMYLNLGNYIAQNPRRLAKAVECYRAALRIKPDYADAHDNLGVALMQIRGGSAEAIGEFEEALRAKPDLAAAHSNLAVALMQDPSRFAEALPHLRAALRIEPESTLAHSNMGAFLQRTGHPAEAVQQFETALRTDPGNVAAHRRLGEVLVGLPGRQEDAEEQFEAALRIDPDDSETQNNLGALLARIPGRMYDAAGHFEEAVRTDPENFRAQVNLAGAQAQLGQRDEAIRHLEAALRIRPDPSIRQRLDLLRAAPPGTEK
jgi:tetratricopeptide (TPR) repeat protein